MAHTCMPYYYTSVSIALVQQPSAHELLQHSFIKRAKEICGLESVFDLYWKYKTRKDQQLHDKQNSVSAEWNQDEE